MSHITGGGFIENVPRIFPKSDSSDGKDGLGCTINVSKWELPGIWQWLKKSGNLEAKEMARTFNCGIGMVLVVGPNEVEEVQRVLGAYDGEGKAEVVEIGVVEEGSGVRLLGLQGWDV